MGNHQFRGAECDADSIAQRFGLRKDAGDMRRITLDCLGTKCRYGNQCRITPRRESDLGSADLRCRNVEERGMSGEVIR